MGETDMAARRRLRRATVVLAWALCFAGVVASAAHAADFVVNSTADAPNAKPGDHLCITAAATCTLRAAVQEANADGGANTISIPRGYYRLSIPPATEAGAAGQGGAAAGALGIHPSVTLPRGGA